MDVRLDSKPISPTDALKARIMARMLDTMSSQRTSVMNVEEKEKERATRSCGWNWAS